MFNRKPFFIVFEGIEGSGKSYQSRKLYQKLKKRKIPVLLTREPGGSKGAEKIRKIILDDYFHKNLKEQFNKYTDTLLYLAARNEHLVQKIIPAIKSKKIIICDRFIDSTFAYQVYGKSVNKSFVNSIHRQILGKIKPDLTFLMKLKISKAMSRLKKRKRKNRYDKFSKKFYLKAQNAFIKLSKKNKKKYIILDSSYNDPNLEKIIFDVVLKKIKK